MRTSSANQRQQLNILQHQMLTFTTFKPLYHAAFSGMWWWSMKRRKNAGGRALGAPWPVGWAPASTLAFRLPRSGAGCGSSSGPGVARLQRQQPTGNGSEAKPP